MRPLLLCALLLSLVLPPRAAARAGEVAAPRAPQVRVGAYYFDGWTGQTDRWHLPPRLREEFAEREPVWGWHTSTPQIMRQQIDCAADAGLRFFAFCWFYPEDRQKATPLNQALQLYLTAPNRQRLDFCLLVANHAGFRIGPADWAACVALWVPLLQHPQAVRAGGKPLLIFFSPEELRQSFGTEAAVADALAQLRQAARAAGLPGVCVAGFFCAPDHLAPATRQGFDALTAYNEWYVGKRAPDAKELQFADLIAGSRAHWDRMKAAPLPYIPLATLGWDKRPWEARDLPFAEQAPRYTDRTPAGVAAQVKQLLQWCAENPERLTPERLALLYAWNENGEGAYLTPTKTGGRAYLDAIAPLLAAPPGHQP